MDKIVVPPTGLMEERMKQNLEWRERRDRGTSRDTQRLDAQGEERWKINFYSLLFLAPHDTHLSSSTPAQHLCFVSGILSDPVLESDPLGMLRTISMQPSICKKDVCWSFPCARPVADTGIPC